MDPENFVTVQQAAEYLNVSEGAVRKAILMSRLPSQIMFGRKLVRRDALEAYKKRTQPTGEKPRGRPKASAATT